MIRITRIAAILVLALLAGSVTYAQKGKNKEQVEIPTFPMEDGKVVYAEVVTQAGSPAELHKRALRWYNSFYKSPSSVIKSNTPEAISGTGRFSLRIYNPKTKSEQNGPTMLYDITVQLKDGKYRFMISDIKQKSSSGTPIEGWIKTNTDGYDQRTAEFLVQISEYMNDLIAKMKEEMASSGEAPSDDW